jgi:hypothetical protein
MPSKVVLNSRPHAVLKRRDKVFLYRSNHFTISIKQRTEVGFSYQMEKLND